MNKFPGWFLKTYAPTFMWCSAFDLLIMYEQIHEDCDEVSFRVVLGQMKKKGYFITKKDPATTRYSSGRVPLLYLRVK